MKELWNQFRAWLGGYFWKPCRLCGAMFGGHQWRECGHITIECADMDWGRVPSLSEMVCPECRRVGRDVAYNVDRGMPYEINGTIHAAPNAASSARDAE